jgi:hypothetical protein
LHRVLDRVTAVIEKLDAQLYRQDHRLQELSHAN